MKEPLYWKIRRFLKQMFCKHNWVDSVQAPHIFYGYKYQEQFCSKCLKRRVDMR